MSSSSQAEMPSAGSDPPSPNSVLVGKPEEGEENLPGQGGKPILGGTLIRRAVSDSNALSKALLEDSIPGLPADDEEDSVGFTGLESAFVYGPNSPRRKGASISDYALVSALSESVPQDYQLPLEQPARAETVKRNSWQHSRDRKVQYIAELERNVNILQTLNAELEARVLSQNHQFLALSMEHNNLKQRLARLEDQMFIKEGQYQLLLNENERLKTAYASASPEAAGSSSFSWQMPNTAKLNLS